MKKESFCPLKQKVSINRFWILKSILLQGEISLNEDPHFAGMFFLHINRLLI